MSRRATPAAVAAALLARAVAPPATIATPAADALDDVLAEVLASLTRDAARSRPGLPAELDAAARALVHAVDCLTGPATTAITTATTATTTTNTSGGGEEHTHSELQGRDPPSGAARQQSIPRTARADANELVKERASGGSPARIHNDSATGRTSPLAPPVIANAATHTGRQHPAHKPQQHIVKPRQSLGQHAVRTPHSAEVALNRACPPGTALRGGSRNFLQAAPYARVNHAPASRAAGTLPAAAPARKAFVAASAVRRGPPYTPPVVEDAELLASACTIGTGNRRQLKSDPKHHGQPYLGATAPAPVTATTTTMTIATDSESPMAADHALVRKKRYRRPVPSAHCHICCRPSRSVPVVVCSNIADGTCRKVICSLCITEYNLAAWELASDPESTWQCTHCVDGCSNVSRAQCFVYSRTNLKRKLAGGKKKIKTLSPGTSDVTGGGPDSVPAQPHEWVGSRTISVERKPVPVELTYSPGTPENSPRQEHAAPKDSPPRSNILVPKQTAA